MRRHLIPTACLALALTACSSDDPEEAAPPSLDDVADRCAPPDSTGEAVDLSASGGTIRVEADTASIEGQLDAIAAVGCVVRGLDGPASIAERVGSTSAMAGPQSEDWDGFEANWAFSGADNRLLFTVDEA